MHATPQRLRIEEPAPLPSLRAVPPGPKLSQRMLRFLRLYGSRSGAPSFTMPSPLPKPRHIPRSLLSSLSWSSSARSWPIGAKARRILREISYALGSILPAGSNTALNYLKAPAKHPVGFLVTTSVITLWTASGVMISWMEGFRRCYELPKTWGLVKERLIAFLLVIFALIPMTFATLLVAVGSKFETRLLPYIDPDFSPYVLLLWGMHPLGHRHSDQHLGHRADLSPCRSPDAALAQRHSRRDLRDHRLVLRDCRIPRLPATLRRLHHHLRIARRRHGAAGLDVPDLSCGAGRRRVQCATISSRHAGERTHGDQQPRRKDVEFVSRLSVQSSSFTRRC